MAKRKADELEDFTTKHEEGAVGKYSKQDVEEGSAMLKEVLVRWKEQVQGGEMSKDEMVAKLRELVKADARLTTNPFFESVQAL